MNKWKRVFFRTAPFVAILALGVAALDPVLADPGLNVLAAATRQDDAAPIARPDLALALKDLPPGYEEAPGLDFSLNGTPLADQVMRRSQPGPGPGWIWTMTYQTALPVTQERVEDIGIDLATGISRLVGTIAELTDWIVEDPAGLGQYAVIYSFDYRVLGEGTVADGALLIFGPGDYMSYLAVISRDGQALTDARRLANVVNARIAQSTSN